MISADGSLLRPRDDAAATPDGVADARQRLLQLRLRKQQAPTAAHPLERRRANHAPLSFAQEGLWFLDRLFGPSALYGVARALRLTGDLDVTALEHALRMLVDRHESLRTSFQQEGDAAVLMENAARGLAGVAVEMTKRAPGRPVVLLCGPGNNGGDGLAAARFLVNAGRKVRVVTLTREPATADAKVHRAVVKAMGMPVTCVEEDAGAVRRALARGPGLIVECR